MDENEAKRLCKLVLLVLKEIHQYGIIHRDLKPENLMIIHDDKNIENVKIVDFGFAEFKEVIAD